MHSIFNSIFFFFNFNFSSTPNANYGNTAAGATGTVANLATRTNKTNLVDDSDKPLTAMAPGAPKPRYPDDKPR